MAEGLQTEDLDGFVVDDFQLSLGVGADKPVMTVGIVGVERDVGDHTECRVGGFERLDGAGDQTGVVIAFLGAGGF